MSSERLYLCIDLKTFFASVECSERNLDPFKTNLVVADPARGNGAICLAISPKMKAMGIRNRCRIFDIPKEVDYITALPRMKRYIEYAANIYAVYLKYIAKEDIHVYSIDECFIDITKYLSLYQVDAKQLAAMLVDDVLKTTGITATAGIGTNLYLAKIAMDITAKHCSDNMGYLDEQSYQETLWHHRPLTDFWQVGRGIMKRLEKYNVVDMHGITCLDEAILYKEFGINAEYLIDHAWGREPTLIADIKAYKAKNNSLSTGQILFEDYNYDDTELVLKEMIELKCLDLVDQHLVTDSISLYIGYSDSQIKGTGGSKKIAYTTSSTKIITEAFLQLYRETTSHLYPIRRINIGFNNILDEAYEAYDLFVDTQAIEKEKKAQEAILKIKKKYGKNAILKGMNMEEKATTRKRNKLIGGHNGE